VDAEQQEEFPNFLVRGGTASTACQDLLAWLRTAESASRSEEFAAASSNVCPSTRWCNLLRAVGRWRRIGAELPELVISPRRSCCGLRGRSQGCLPGTPVRWAINWRTHWSSAEARGESGFSDSWSVCLIWARTNPLREVPTMRSSTGCSVSQRSHSMVVFPESPHGKEASTSANIRTATQAVARY
jgi:hypothetical protein